MVAATTERVPNSTSPQVNQRIRRRTEMNIAYYAKHPEEIEGRLRELDEEWDIERLLETGSSSLTIAGILLAVTRGRKWLLLSLTVQGFLLQHAIEGWCPPLPVLRSLGVRTAEEIGHERAALKAVVAGGEQK